eukprot:4942837-Prymnesium_polylepis.2
MTQKKGQPRKKRAQRGGASLAGLRNDKGTSDLPHRFLFLLPNYGVNYPHSTSFSRLGVARGPGLTPAHTSMMMHTYLYSLTRACGGAPDVTARARPAASTTVCA